MVSAISLTAPSFPEYPLGRECILLPQDIRDEQGCNRVIETVVQRWGRIDILVNNASVMYDTPSITGKPIFRYLYVGFSTDKAM